MAAPAPTARQTPNGVPLQEGQSTKITFASVPDVAFWEVSVKPPGLDGGDMINNTTMHNVKWRTMHPRKLVTRTEATAVVTFDPAILPLIDNLVNKNDEITFTYSDGTTDAMWGALQKFEPSEFKEGEQPQATITIVPTNYDTGDHTEAGPVVSPVAGT